jgi:murein L,D-transpeptidase YafK
MGALFWGVVAFFWGEPPPPRSPPAIARPAPAPVIPEPPPCAQIARIEVEKSKRRLRAYCEGGAVVEMTAAVGRENEGTKLFAGDQRTPEGEYRVSEPARQSRFHLFLPIDYPSRADAQWGYVQGRISARDYQRIVAAHDRGRPPPGDTALGGEIGLHGEGVRWRGDTQHIDWTMGCIGLTDADISFLVEHTEVGTRVLILP